MLPAERQRNTMKKLLIALALCAALLLTSAALADGPAGGIRPRTVSPNAPKARSAYGVTTQKDTYEAGETVTFTASMPAGGYWDMSLCVLDGSYADPWTADTLWVSDRITTTTCDYDMIWVPGTYVIFYDIYGPGTGGSGLGTSGSVSGSPVNVASGYYDFEVTECTGTNLLYQRAQQTVAACRGEDDFETLVNLHDWVLDHCTYDHSFTYYSAESLFFLETGVCNSYSRAFDLLLRTAGIGSRRVLGWADEIADNTGHAWNAACLDGEWYLYDCTWDDGNSDLYYTYRYCGLPSELMDLDNDHIVQYIPGGEVSCTSMDSNYFVRSGDWRDVCGSAAEETEAALAEGRHRMTVHTGVSFGTNGGGDTYRVNRIAAAGIGAWIWTDALGQMCTGEFTATRGSDDITGRMIGDGTLTLPGDTRTVEAEAFRGCEANYVELPDACVSVGSAAFGYGRLWEIRMGAGVNDIAEDAFAGLPNVMIIAPSGSYAARWALSHGYETAEE